LLSLEREGHGGRDNDVCGIAGNIRVQWLAQGDVVTLRAKVFALD
jgi:hypothetical protein